MKQVIISIAALVLSQAVVAKENRAVGELLNHGGKAISESCQKQGFDIVCVKLTLALENVFNDFCESLTSPGAEGLRSAYFERCFAAPVTTFYRYEPELRSQLERFERQYEAIKTSREEKRWVSDFSLSVRVRNSYWDSVGIINNKEQGIESSVSSINRFMPFMQNTNPL